MTKEEAIRGITLEIEQATKAKLTGQVVITLSFQDGGLAKAGKQVMGPLLQGARPAGGKPPDFEGRTLHGG